MIVNVFFIGEDTIEEAPGTCPGLLASWCESYEPCETPCVINVCFARNLADNLPLLVNLVKKLAAVLCYENKVLNSYSIFTCDVYARLN